MKQRIKEKMQLMGDFFKISSSSGVIAYSEIHIFEVYYPFPIAMDISFIIKTYNN